MSQIMLRLLGLTSWQVMMLRDYEGAGAFWRLALAGLLRCAPWTLLLLSFAAGVVAGINLSTLRLIGCSVVFLASTGVAAWTQRRAAWLRPTVWRLSEYNDLDPERYVQVLLTSTDDPRTFSALRRARLVPGPFFRQQPPFEVRDAVFSWRLNVNESSRFPLTASPEDFVYKVALTLANSGVRARVAYADAYPDGTVTRWHEG